MTERVSSFSQTGSTLNQILRLEAKFADATNAQSSGLKSESFAGIASDAQNLLNLQSQFSALNTQTSNGNLALSKINIISGALSGIADVIATALAGIGTAISSASFVGIGSTQQATLQASITSITGFLNSQYTGSYLFGGNVTDVPPVNVNDSGYTSITISSANTSYYQGDSAIQSVQIDDSVSVSYGITADNTAFEKAFRALTVAIANPSNITELKAAFDLLSQASNGVGTLQSQTASKVAAVEAQLNANISTLSFVELNISDITNADIAQVSTELSNLKNQLDASFSALAGLLKLRLTDFLR